MSFTLNVPGATVSGEVISFRTYMSIYNELFAVSSPIEIEPYAEGVAIEAIPAPQFIHMRNARVITGNTLIPDTGMLWRGRVADVSGFAYGGLAPAKR